MKWPIADAPSDAPATPAQPGAQQEAFALVGPPGIAHALDHATAHADDPTHAHADAFHGAEHGWHGVALSTYQDKDFD